MNTKNFFIVILLFLGAIIAFIPLSIIGVIYTLVKHIILLDYRPGKQLTPILHNFALLLDGMANAMAGELLNDTLLKKKEDGTYYINTVKWGKWHHTISEITGVNEERRTLNKWGIIFTKFLWTVLNKNHSILSIRRDIVYPTVEDEKLNS